MVVVECLSDCTSIRGDLQMQNAESVARDFGNLPRAGSASDSMRFYIAVLQHIVDHAIILKTSEVWREAESVE